MTTKKEKPRVKTRVAGARARSSAVAERGKNWIESQEPTSRKGATIGWFRRYREADGQLYAMLLTGYIFITLLPLALVLETYMYSDPNALSDHLINRLGLSGPAATFLGAVITGAGGHKLGATLIAIADLMIAGLGFGRVLQLVYARSWGIKASKGMIIDQLRYLTCLLVLIAMFFVYLVQSKVLDGQPSWIGWSTSPIWLALLVAYFVWLPRLLLHKRVSVRDVLPGALLTVVALCAMRLISSFLLSNWLVWYSKYFGGFGVVMALYFWLLIAATILVVSAALSPAMAERRDLLEAATEISHNVTESHSSTR